MTDVVYKYPLDVPVTVLSLPPGSVVRAFQIQGDQPTLWVQQEARVGRGQTRQFVLAGTGHPISAEWVYVGTAQRRDGIVFHAFEVP